MKTPPDYKHLGEVGAKAGAELLKERAHTFAMVVSDRSAWWEQDQTARIAFARAVIEEYDRLRLAEVGEGLPSVEGMADELTKLGWQPVLDAQWQNLPKFRNLMLSAFAKQLEAEKAKTLEAEKDLLSLATKLEAIRKAYDTWRNSIGHPTDHDFVVAMEDVFGADPYAELKAAWESGKRIRNCVAANPTWIQKTENRPSGYDWSYPPNSYEIEPDPISEKVAVEKERAPCIPDARHAEKIGQLTDENSKLQAKLAAAEKRLGEAAGLSEKWRNTRCGSGPTGQIYKEQLVECAQELEKALRPVPTTAEEVSRAEFEKVFRVEFPNATWPIGAGFFRIWQAARASQQTKLP